MGAFWQVTSWLPVRVSFGRTTAPFGVKHLFDAVLGKSFKPDRVAELFHDGCGMNAEHRAEVQNCRQLRDPGSILDPDDR